MTRDEFDHAVRAAAAVLGVREVMVIGSQALHGSLAAGLPPEALRSVEVDVVPLDDEDGWKADLIDGSIGEGSMFHASFGIYAQGVSDTTAVVGPGWRDRLVRYESAGTNGVVAWCLEVHDLWLAKAIAGRPKDIEYCGALLRSRLVDPATLQSRLASLQGIDEASRASVAALISRNL